MQEQANDGKPGSKGNWHGEGSNLDDKIQSVYGNDDPNNVDEGQQRMESQGPNVVNTENMQLLGEGLGAEAGGDGPSGGDEGYTDEDLAKLNKFIKILGGHDDLDAGK